MRKRKRAQAVDPCLGVYADPSRAHEPRFGTTPTPFDTKDSTKTTDLPSAHSRSHTPSQSTELVSEPAPECLTVETFLRRSAEKSRTKVYGKRRQRVVAALRRESDTDYQGISFLISSLHCDHLTHTTASTSKGAHQQTYPLHPLSESRQKAIHYEESG